MKVPLKPALEMNLTGYLIVYATGKPNNFENPHRWTPVKGKAVFMPYAGTQASINQLSPPKLRQDGLVVSRRVRREYEETLRPRLLSDAVISDLPI